MVEWKKLGEVCDIGTGSNNREDACDNGCYPFYVRSQEVLKINTYLYDEEAILIPGEGGIGEIFHYVNGKYGLHQRTYRVHPISDNVKGRYLYYYLFTYFKAYINSKSYKSTAASIRKPMLLDFPIVIPSLSEQKRIVGILDTFTDSIENLKQQIAQRRIQYEHYREILLTNVDREDTNWKELSEIADLYKGTYVTKKESNEGAFPVVMGGQKVAYYIDKYNSEGESIVISRSGINAGYVSFWNQPIFVSDGYRIDTNEKIIKKYLFYFLKSREGQINSSKKGAGVPHIQSKYLLSILVPQPPLSEQQRIVSILDTFEASISNLEAQLEQRQKQYEYYRNKLLSFEKEEH